MMEASHLPYGENECAMVQSEFPIPYSITTAPHQVMNSIEAAMWGKKAQLHQITDNPEKKVKKNPPDLGVRLF